MLSKMDITALRQADRVSFHHHENGDSFIIATKEHRRTDKDPFARDIEHQIAVASHLTNYEDRGIIWPDRASYKAFGMIHIAQTAASWQTIVSLLKAGDALTLDWQWGGWNTVGLRDVGMAGDRLLLKVARGKKTLTFSVDHYIGPAYSMGRMVSNVREAVQRPVAAVAP